MSAREIPKKKYKKPKQNTQSTTNPQSSNKKSNSDSDNGDQAPARSPCPLLAKDSEWIDILQTSQPVSSRASARQSISQEEEVLQLVECEDDPEVKPLAILFPGLLEKDPDTLKGMLNRVMSTTEVTRHLVDLGQKANFTFMKKANRLIPRDKKWLESLAENNSNGSLESELFRSNMDYDADTEVTDEEIAEKNVKKKKLVKLRPERSLDMEGSICTIDTVIDKDELKSKKNISGNSSQAVVAKKSKERPTTTTSKCNKCEKRTFSTPIQSNEKYKTHPSQTTSQCKDSKSSSVRKLKRK